jgi:hypothetical protein
MTNTIGEIRMKNSLRTLRQEQNLALWSKQVENCNNSGLSVAKWCRENNIPVSTYWSRQKKVWGAYSNNKFVEVTVQPEVKTSAIAVTISLNDFSAGIHSGADEETLTAVLRAIKNA